MLSRKLDSLGTRFFRILDCGDVVLADRGFTLTEDFAVHGARLELPAFSRGKTQLTQCEVEKSKQLSMIRIHVERVIGLLKTFTILKRPLPVDVLKINFLLYVVHLLTVVCSIVPWLGSSSKALPVQYLLYCTGSHMISCGISR